MVESAEVIASCGGAEGGGGERITTSEFYECFPF